MRALGAGVDRAEVSAGWGAEKLGRRLEELPAQAEALP